jgi:hypothetical protein
MSESQTRSAVAAMRQMSAIDGVEDPQEQELIEMLLDGLTGSCELDFSQFSDADSQRSFLRLVTFVAVVDTTINDAECSLLQKYIDEFESSETVQGLIDHVGSIFLKQVFADSDLLNIWLPKLQKDLRLSDSAVEDLRKC